MERKRKEKEKVNEEKGNELTILDTIEINGLSNLTTLALPVSLEVIIGSFSFVDNLKKLVCSPKLLQYFKGAHLVLYRIPEGIEEILESEVRNIFHFISVSFICLPRSLKLIEPNFFENLSVSKISGHPMLVKFFNSKFVTTVILPDFVQEIPEGSFEKMPILRYLKLNEELIIMESKAFNSCPQLISIKIPSTVYFLALDSFYNSYRLKEIDIKDNNNNVCDQLITFHKADKNKNKLTEKDVRNFINLQSIEIPNDIQVEEGIFCDKKITSIKCNPGDSFLLPQVNKRHLKSIYINDGIIILLQEYFLECDFVELLQIPLSVEEIEENTFQKFFSLRILE